VIVPYVEPLGAIEARLISIAPASPFLEYAKRLKKPPPATPDFEIAIPEKIKPMASFSQYE